MKKISLVALGLMLTIVSLSGCEVIGGIFKAGVGVGVFAVIAVIAVIIMAKS